MAIAGIGVVGPLLLPATALAQTFDVKQLDVTGVRSRPPATTRCKGRWRIRRRDDNRSAHDLSLDYGVSNAWRLSGLLKLENPLDKDFRLAKSAVENIWVFRPVPKAGGLGLGLVYLGGGRHRSGQHEREPVRADHYAQGRQGDLYGQSLFEKTFGRNRIEGIALNYGWNVKYTLNDTLAIGVEGFGLVENLGDPAPLAEQQHRLGPALFATLKLGEHLTITPTWAYSLD